MDVGWMEGLVEEWTDWEMEFQRIGELIDG